MAINIDSQDLLSYPGNVKRITVDQASIVPSGYAGDEQFVLSFSTSAYSDNVNRTRIQTYYITSFKAGWCKSSGFAGTKFALDSAHNSIEVRIDATTSGIAGSGYYRVTLDHNDGIPLDGEVVAKDIENKLHAIADTLAVEDTGYRLAYLNSTVEFTGGRFWIVSGSVGQYYAGTNRSSVKVRASQVNDCASILGFDLSVDSESLSSVSIKEAMLITTFSGTANPTGTATIGLNQAVGAITNDCMAITNGTDTEYFQVTGTPSNTTIQFDATKVSSDYLAYGSKVQLLRAQDPDAIPYLWYDSVDKITRHGVKTIINQVDYSS